MKPELEQTYPMMVDLTEQPEGSHYLFVVIAGRVMDFRVDGVRFNGNSMEGFVDDKVVVAFNADANWTVVDSAYVELMTKPQKVEQSIQALQASFKLAHRYQQAYSEAQDETMRYGGITPPRGPSNPSSTNSDFEKLMRDMGWNDQEEIL